jgi:hypothetical protein
MWSLSSSRDIDDGSSTKRSEAEKSSELRRLELRANETSLEPKLTAESSAGKKMELCRTLFEQTRLLEVERLVDDDIESSDSSMAL